MTISTTTSSISYSGNGVTTVFAVSFPFFASDELEVIERVTSTGAETTKALTTDYTVSGGDGSTGNVTMLAAPASGRTLTIRRATDRTQETDYPENDPFPAASHERALDRLTAIVQEVERDQTGRALLVPKTDGAVGTLPNSVDRAGQYLGFDSSGNPIAVAAAVGSTVISAFAETILDDANAAAVRTTIDAPSSAAMPVGAVMPYAGSAAPSLWLLCYGQAVSRSTYAGLFSVLGTTYGTGDGSTTFNLPDLRGRAPFGKDNMGGSAASRITSGNSGITGTTLGAAGGDERLHQHSHTITDPGHTHTMSAAVGASSAGSGFATGTASVNETPTSRGSADSHTTGITVNINGAGNSQNMPPALVLNYNVYAGV